MIVTETNRMAEIVKKIGRITKYETKEYVGSASIIDLDRATAPSEPSEPPPPPPIEPLSAAVLEEVEDEPTSRINLDELLAGKTGAAARRRSASEAEAKAKEAEGDRTSEETVAGHHGTGRPA